MTETTEENAKITEEVVKPQQVHPKGKDLKEGAEIEEERKKGRKSPARARDIERLELDELQAMENKIKEQIRLKKMASIEREPTPKPTEKRRERKEDDK